MHGDQHQPVQYVCGFAFAAPEPASTVWATDDSVGFLTPVLLLRKAKPQWQAGKLNGIGGKIELGESPRGAMAREFHEETGIDTQITNWSTFHTERWRSGVTVHFMMNQTLWLHELKDAEKRMAHTAEPVFVNWLNDHGEFVLSRGEMLYNIRYLVGMAHALSKLAEDDRPI